MCIVTVNETLYGKVIEKGGTNTIVLGNATPKTSTTGGSTTNAKLVDTIYTSKPSTIKDTSTIGYKAKGISAKGEYIFDKYSCASGTIKNVNGTFKCTTAGTTKTTYTCSVGDPKEINGVYKCVKTENTPKTKGCEDPYFTYNSWNNTCTKNVVSTKQIRPNVSTKYQYTWSRSTFVDGWTKTGKTRTVRE
ncbi:MAG TPA: hypothetical protein DCY94_02865 [Firmicutes bacterium]|nr:hypothetical protein [Bacillota bacterium]